MEKQQHQSRFKFYLVDSAQRQRELAAVGACVDELKSLKATAGISDAEMVALFVVFIMHLRREEWGMSSGQRPSVLSHRGLALCELSATFDFLKKLKSSYLMDVFVEYRPRQLPQSVFEVLWAWSQQKYDLHLFSTMPTPLQMLTYQANGARVVTLDLSAAVRGELVDGKRDAFEFLLHDLIHADLFFRDVNLHEQQKEFFGFLLLQIERFKLLEHADDLFLQDLHYLMSDMNSHRAHLQAHWEAILIQWQLRKEGKGRQEQLSLHGRTQVQQMRAF